MSTGPPVPQTQACRPLLAAESSVVVTFKFVLPGEPLAIVIGPTHEPFFILADGVTAPAARRDR